MSRPPISTGTRAAMPASYRGRIDEDVAVAYGFATNDPNPLYLDGSVAPPLFTVNLILPAHQEAYRSGEDVGPLRGSRRSVHGEHDVFFWGLTRPGMSLQWDVRLEGYRQTSSGVLLTRRSLIFDIEGSLLIEHLWSDFHIGAVLVGPYAESSIPDHAFPEGARERPVGRRSVMVDWDQAFRYAEASGDFSLHALDDSVARAEGYPGRILPGICTLAMTSGMLVDLVAGGDPRRLRRIACRFSEPTFPDQALEVQAYDAGRTDEGGRSIAFEASQEGAIVLTHGRVELIPE